MELECPLMVMMAFDGSSSKRVMEWEGPLYTVMEWEGSCMKAAME